MLDHISLGITNLTRARRFYEREGWTADGGVKIEEFGGRPLREVRYTVGVQ